METTEKDYLWMHLRALPYFRALLRSVEARFYRDLNLPSPLLDLGCGDGHFASVAFDGPVDIGVDPDRASLLEARSRGCYRALILSDGGHLPLPDASVGSAFSNSVLEHIPHLEEVLAELGRVLRPGAPLVFTVPNPGYRHDLSLSTWLRRVGFPGLGQAYEDWFMRMSRTIHLYEERGWQARLDRAGLEIEKTFRYFSPSALRALEWGHYFGSPCLLPRRILGRWIIAPYRWNLRLTEAFVRRYYEELPTEQGTYSFYLARKR